MLRRSLVVLAAASSLLAGCSSSAPPAGAQTACAPVVIGHRGEPATAPEETLASFEAAIDDGASIIEGDVQFTRDGHAVMLHDSTVDRTTNGKGPVAQKTLAEVQALDAGIRMGKKGKGVGVPTLEQFLRLAASRKVQVIVELKSGGLSPTQARTFLRTLAETGMTKQALVESFHSKNLELVRTLDRSTRTALIVSKPVGAARAASVGQAILPQLSIATPDRVKAWKAAGLVVYPWTADTPEQWTKMLQAGADGVMTNRTGEYQNWARRQCHHSGSS